jgi:hypothetical protein
MKPAIPEHAFLAVFDGHSGSYIAEQLKFTLHTEFIKALHHQYDSQQEITSSQPSRQQLHVNDKELKLIRTALLLAFAEADKACLFDDYNKQCSRMQMSQILKKDSSSGVFDAQASGSKNSFYLNSSNHSQTLSDATTFGGIIWPDSAYCI